MTESIAVEKIHALHTFNTYFQYICNSAHFFRLVIYYCTDQLLGIDLRIIFSPQIQICLNNVLYLLAAFYSKVIFFLHDKHFDLCIGILKAFPYYIVWFFVQHNFYRFTAFLVSMVILCNYIYDRKVSSVWPLSHVEHPPELVKQKNGALCSVADNCQHTAYRPLRICGMGDLLYNIRSKI